MALRIITDSASDLSQDQARDLDVTVVPLSVVFADGIYRDGVDLGPVGFFEKLVECGDVPTTSQVSPAQYETEFRVALAAGDDVVCLTLSSDLSGCYQSACIAREMLSAEEQARVFVVDTRQVTLGEQILVKCAIDLRDRGASAGEVAAALEACKDDVKVIALLDTLEYLKKGGRISPAVALAGALLNIKPVIEIADGKVGLIGKARGSKNGNNLLCEFVAKHGGIDFARPFSVAYSGLSDKLLRKYLKDSQHLYADWQGDIPVVTIGAVIGTHVGPGAIAVGYFANKR